MINSTDSIKYNHVGFDAEKYIKLQKDKIIERISNFTGRLYLEIGGKFMYDAHASRVLPGFLPDSKKIIFSAFKDNAEILFCINADDIINNRQLSNKQITYQDHVLKMLETIEHEIGIIPQVVINKIPTNTIPTSITHYSTLLTKKGYAIRKRYIIDGYPADTTKILSAEGFGKDDHIPISKNLVLVTGAASNSGKMSTCLGQIYLDHQQDIKSGYAKYETFPIWNLPLNHPINLAYEAATVDIGDYNCIDSYHQKAYKMDVVNYNRDVEAFEIVMNISRQVITHKNYMRKYKSPTDMGISCAGYAISNDEICSIASYREIIRRKKRYQQMIDRNEGEKIRIDMCEKLEQRCIEYMTIKGYNLEIEL